MDQQLPALSSPVLLEHSILTHHGQHLPAPVCGVTPNTLRATKATKQHLNNSYTIKNNEKNAVKS